GVVADVRDRLDRAAEPTFYASFRQRSRQIASFWIAVQARDAEHLIPVLREIVQRANPDVPPVFTTGEVLFESTVAQRRFDLGVLAAFGGAALAVALAGIYAAIAFNVARRTHEIGVRIALGALGRSVTAMVVRRALL